MIAFPKAARKRKSNAPRSPPMLEDAEPSGSRDHSFAGFLSGNILFAKRPRGRTLSLLRLRGLLGSPISSTIRDKHLGARDESTKQNGVAGCWQLDVSQGQNEQHEVLNYV
jgi:hypothetical protein